MSIQYKNFFDKLRANECTYVGRLGSRPDVLVLHRVFGPVFLHIRGLGLDFSLCITAGPTQCPVCHNQTERSVHGLVTLGAMTRKDRF